MKSLLLCSLFNSRTLKSVRKKITVPTYQRGAGQDRDEGKACQYKGLFLLTSNSEGHKYWNAKIWGKWLGCVWILPVLRFVCSLGLCYPLFSPSPFPPRLLKLSLCVAQDHCTALNTHVGTKEKKENKLSSGLCSSVGKIFSKQGSMQISLYF